jgi:phytol kinase
VEIGIGGQLACYAAWLAVVFVAAETLRHCQVDGERVRKVIHIGVGNIILLAWILDAPRSIGIGASVLFSLVAWLSYHIKILPGLNGVNRQSFGTVFYAASIGILIALFWTPGRYMFAVIGVLVMTWGDAIAALVGQAWGRHPYTVFGNRKSWEGSLAMWGVSTLAIASMLLAGHYWLGVPLPWWLACGVAVLVAAIATGLEVFSWRGIDNLTVPLASGALSYWLLQWMHG